MILVVVAAAAPRLAQLNVRPMHGDEAVHAVKFAELWRTGRYVYDPQEFHGPTLYYATLPSVWLRGAKDSAETDAATYRIVPALFGAGLILLVALLADGFGRTAALAAALLAALSPALVFYSRYYIQETLLAFFTFALVATGWRYAHTRRPLWAWLAGASLGLMHATKETCVIACGCLAMAVFATIVWQRWNRGTGLPLRPYLRWGIVASLGLAALVSILLYSGFFSNPRGPLDSIRAYATYFGRAGDRALHVRPWHYYLQTLLFTSYAGTPVWSEGLIVVLALVGLVAAFLRHGPGDANTPLVRFLALYTILMTVVYSAIPYKTPWCVIQFLQPMTLLAGVGAAALLRWLSRVWRAVVGLVVCAATVHLGWQAYAASFRYFADQRNPYVYAHPVPDVARLADWVDQLAAMHPNGRHMLIKVIAANPWPLPWYLRQYDHVGYWDQPPADPDAPIVIVAGEFEPLVTTRLRNEYHVSRHGLRPEEVLSVHVRRDVYEAFAVQAEQGRPQRRASDVPP